MVEDLIPQMKNLNIESGQSAFDIACQKGHEKIVLLLIKNYKDLNINLMEKANEVFHLACKQGYEQIIKELRIPTLNHRPRISRNMRENLQNLAVISKKSKRQS